MADDWEQPVPLGLQARSGVSEEAVEAEVREKIYADEIAEIAQLREALRSQYDTLAGRELTARERVRGLQILDRRLAMTEAMYAGEPLLEFEPLEPLGQETPELVKPLPWPKSARMPEPDEPLPKLNSEPVPKTTPRKVARAAGKKYYISGKRCPQNHDSRRYVSTGQCVVCVYIHHEASAAAKLVENRLAT